MAPRPVVATMLAATLALGVLLAGSAQAHPGHTDADPLLGDSTLEHTVRGDDQEHINDPRGSDSFSLLRLGPGEPYVVREDLGSARSGRENRRRSLIYLSQLTDFQIADQQSPARVEFIDPLGGPVSSAWRPQEMMVPHQVELTVRQVNEFLRSPVPDGDGNRAEMANAVLTGDLADNMQLNETEWVVQLMQGGKFENGELDTDLVDPNSGSDDVDTYPPECQTAVQLGLLDPDDANRYVGVQNYDDYPPTSQPEDRASFYDPNDPDGNFDDWPRYEGLADRAQQPLRAEGLGVPFYTAFGNHDALVQGNQWANQTFDEIARGCVKVFPAPGAEDFLDDLLGGGFTQNVVRHPALITKALEQTAQPTPAQVPDLEDTPQSFVPPDDDRRFVDRREFKQLHDTGWQEDEHGFALVDSDELEASDGAAAYYDFSPAPGIRYIVLDTVSYGGQFPLSSSGNISHPQFQWLQRKLERGQERDELIMLFAHHGITSLTSPVPHEAAPPCRNPTTGDDVSNVVGPGCDRDPRDSRKPGELTPHQGSDLQELLLEFPNVIALIAGHSHNNRVTPVPDDGGGGFWEIKSPAVVDWPAQHRLIELMDNDDGTLSIFGTLLDDASPPRSPTPDEEEDQQQEGPSAASFEFEESEVEEFTTEDLSSIGRTLSYNDPQGGPDGPPGGRRQGIETDRNVELILADPRVDDPDPRPPPPPRPPDRDPDRDRDADRDEEREAEPAATDEPAEATGALPFTGLWLLLLLLLAAALLAGGKLAKRLSGSGGTG